MCSAASTAVDGPAFPGRYEDALVSTIIIDLFTNIIIFQKF